MGSITIFKLKKDSLMFPIVSAREYCLCHCQISPCVTLSNWFMFAFVYLQLIELTCRFICLLK